MPAAGAARWTATTDRARVAPRRAAVCYRSGVRRFAQLLGLSLALAIAAPAAGAEPPTTHEILSNRPSGFWTSNRPAVGGAYRWRLLGLGVVIAAVTGYGMLRLVRRASAERAGRR
jgi:hypothetical protein